MANRKGPDEALFLPGGLICQGEDETRLLGIALGESVKEPRVFSLEGPLGAGKTQFVKGLAIGLGVEEEASSPTFALIHEYATGRVPLVHFDLYRLENIAELWGLGFEDYVGQGVLAIEWGDKFPEALPQGSLRIRFEILSGEKRRLTGSVVKA